ncbi:unnamed protein product [Prunus armeniaca]
MSNLSRVLERQQKQREEIWRRRAQEDRDADEEEGQMLVAAVCMMDQSRQHRRHRAPNVDRRKESRSKNLIEDYFILNSLYHASKFRERYRMQQHLFQKIMHDICNYNTYFIQKHDVVGALGLIPE